MSYPMYPSSPPFRVSMKRPNGKQYRAFKEPKAIVLDGEWDFQVLVIRCDDYELAKTLANAELTYAAGEVLEVSSPVFGWWRESIRDGEPYWVPDEAKGAPGYFFQEVRDI